MKKILVIYATQEGQTAKVAGKLRDHLAGTGAHVTLANVTDEAALGQLDLAEFDLLVFGASIHVGKIETAMAKFINRYREVIAGKPRSLFIVLMAAATKDPERREKALADVRHKVADQLQVTFDDTEMIAGALMYTQYNWFIRWTMKRIAKAEGGDTDTSRDHEYTDWAQVAAYAKRLS